MPPHTFSYAGHCVLPILHLSQCYMLQLTYVGLIFGVLSVIQLMFWYDAQNENGDIGMVPSNFLKPFDNGMKLLMCVCVFLVCVRVCVCTYMYVCVCMDRWVGGHMCVNS